MSEQFDKLKLSQSNSLITSSYSFTTHEIDLFVIICSVVYRYGNNNDFYQFTVPYEYLLETMGIDVKNSKYVKKAVKELQKKPITIKDTPKEWISAPLLCGVKIDYSRNQIHFNIDSFIKPLIIDLRSRFTTFYISSCLKLTKKYSKRIYMMANQFANTGVWYVTVDDLRERLDLKEKYKVWKQFDQRVIEGSLLEINLKTELKIKVLEYSKRGKANTGYKFEIVRKPTTSAQLEDKFKEVLSKLDFASWQIDNVRHSMTEKELNIYMHHLRLADLNGTIRTNKGHYLRGMMKNKGVNLDTKI